MYGDCRAETNADDDGEMSDGELYGDISTGLLLELAILMVRDLVGSLESEKSASGICLESSAEGGASPSMTINESTKLGEDLNMQKKFKFYKGSAVQNSPSLFFTVVKD